MPHKHQRTVIDKYESGSSSSGSSDCLTNDAFAKPSQSNEPVEAVATEASPSAHVAVSFTANMVQQEKTKVNCTCCDTLLALFKK